MRRTFLTADWHAGVDTSSESHRHLLRAKPTDVLMYEWIRECWEWVLPEDELIFLGDMIVMLDALECFRELPPCRTMLVLGDKEAHSPDFSEEEFLARNHEMGIFQRVCQSAILDIAGTMYFLSHKPLECIRQHRPALCGHVHGMWRTSVMPNGAPIINVGIDAWGTLVSDGMLRHQLDTIAGGHYDANCFPTMWSSAR